MISRQCFGNATLVVKLIVLLSSYIFALPDECSNEDDYIEACRHDVSLLFVDGTGMRQDLGIGKAPSEIVEEIRLEVCKMNYYWKSEIAAGNDDDDSMRLIRKKCVNHSEMCSLWAIQGQCESEAYQSYTDKTCPLACRSCSKAVWRSQTFLGYLESLATDLDLRNIDGAGRRQATLEKLMEDLDLDPSVLQREIKGKYNWLWILNERLMAIVPQELLATFPTLPSNEQLKSFEAVLPKPVVEPIQYRDRGFVVARKMVELIDQLIVRPLQLTASFAIPSDEALQSIASLQMPIIEVGAGSGYWTALLRAHGVEVEAYDVGGTSDSSHEFYDVFFTEIVKGVCADVLQHHGNLENHALLMVWPNDPDPIDNPQFCSSEYCQATSQKVWDVQCLETFLAGNGTTVIFVGEREATIRKQYPESRDVGISATSAFQKQLQDNFVLERTEPLPKFWLNEDDMTIWRQAKQSRP